MSAELSNNSSLDRINQILRSIAVGDFSKSYDALCAEDAPLKATIDQIINNLKAAVKHINLIAQGRYDIDFAPQNDRDELGHAISDMTEILREMSNENKKSAWIKSGQAELANIMRGDQNCHDLAKNILSFLARYINALTGTIYQVSIDQEDVLELVGSFALHEINPNQRRIKFGQGLVGQCAIEKEQLYFNDVPDYYLTINSSLGEIVPRHIIIIPFLIKKDIVGVMELGAIDAFDSTKMELLRQVSENIAIALKSSQDSEKLQILLGNTALRRPALQ